jgi:hypothetical protein
VRHAPKSIGGNGRRRRRAAAATKAPRAAHAADRVSIFIVEHAPARAARVRAARPLVVARPASPAADS